jgi:hypothetical protein
MKTLEATIKETGPSTQISNSSRSNEYAYTNYLMYYNNKPYTFWQIQIPGQIKLTYEFNNGTRLLNFQYNVDAMRDAQDSIPWIWGTTGLAIVLGSIFAAALGGSAAAVLAVAVALTAVSGVCKLIGCSETIKRCQTDCATFFNQVVPVSIP